MCGLLSAAGSRDVIALGGGSVLSERVRTRSAIISRCWSRLIPRSPGSVSGGGRQAAGAPTGAFLALHRERRDSMRSSLTRS